jgi:hypothetical protein
VEGDELDGLDVLLREVVVEDGRDENRLGGHR